MSTILHHSHRVRSDVLWVPASNSLNSLTVLVDWLNRLLICAGGTSSSLRPLRKSDGTVTAPMRSSDGHFWWRRKRNGARKGRTLGTRSVRDRKVFSTMRPWICNDSMSTLRSVREYVVRTHAGGVATRQINRYGSSDALPVQEDTCLLQRRVREHKVERSLRIQAQASLVRTTYMRSISLCSPNRVRRTHLPSLRPYPRYDSARTLQCIFL
jgi:hypothetical protein